MHWCRFEKTPLKQLGPAPRIGEHAALSKMAPPQTKRASRDLPEVRQIFAGVNVIDFTWAAAGPIGIKQLSDNGATVVKIESSKHPDSVRLGGPFKDDKPGLNRSGFFADFNSSKLSIALDMTHKRVGEIIEPLLRWGDIVAVSFRPGVMERWGFGYERLRQINPRLIMINSSLFGLSGPWSSSPGFGAQGQAISGFNGQTGWPDRSPVAPKGAYTDSVSARYMATALVAAMIHRERTGEGQFIELAQVETGVQFLAPQLLQYQLTGEEAWRNGNADPYALLHGVFPCKGEDRWIAIEVWTPDQWNALVRVLDAQELRQIEPLAGCAPQERERIETHVSARTMHWDGFELMAALRAARVPCGFGLRASELLQDPCLRRRGHFCSLDHVEMGRLDYNGPAYRFDKTPTKLRVAAPLLGEHTNFVLSDLLAFSAEKIAEFSQAKMLI